MKRLIKLLFSLVLVTILSFTVIVKASVEDFSSLDVVKTSSVMTDQELDAGVKLYQVGTTAYNDGIIEETRLNDYVVSWLDYGDNPSVRIVNWTSDFIEDWGGGKATVLAQKYEESHPGYLVVGAINGDFFHITENDEVVNLSMQEGEMLKPYVMDALGSGVLGWTYDGRIVSGIPTISDSMYLEVLDADKNKLNEKTISSVNGAISETGITLLTKDIEKNGEIEYDFTGMTVVELNYTLHRFSLDGNHNNDRLFVKGNITKISKDLGSGSVIPERCVYLVAKDDSLDHLKVDDFVRCQYHLTGKWADVYNTTGYYDKILENGKSMFYQSSRNDYSHLAGDLSYVNCKKNRTVIGMKEDGSTVFMTIEYRKDGNYGASYYECAEYLRSIGCVEGWLLDGGGSTSMALRQPSGGFKLIAGGSDGQERSNGNAMLLVVKDPGMTPVMKNVTRFSATVGLQDNDSPFRKDVFDIKMELNGEVYDYNDEPLTFNNLEEDTEYTITIHYKMNLENGKVFSGKLYRTFETFAFTAPNVTFSVAQKSNTELVLAHKIRKADGVEISNFVIHQGDTTYNVNPGESIHVTNLTPLSNYEFYATFDAYDPVTSNIYHITTKTYECSTLKEARPIITCFKLVKHAGTVLEFEYGYSDQSNKVEYAYIEFFGSENIVEGTNGIKRFEGFDLTQSSYTFTFRLKTATGEIVSDKIILEQMDELPPSEEIPHTHTFVEGKCECGEVDPNYVPPHVHNFVEGKCECGETDPNYVEPHTHTFVEGKCECGEVDPNYVPPHVHNFVEGKCECGEIDPNYTPEPTKKKCGKKNVNLLVEIMCITSLFVILLKKRK
ncbi:MAG: phosphodiester glycosidase family protein [Erysipelotrichaceae bacterium]|nr:phosphodiester glycosidase family protein [Erysipelotrichaceae bacterium]